MARKITVDFESDISGKSPAETVEFGWAGRQYEIDLTAAEKEAFQKAIQQYLDKGRVKVGKGANQKTKPARTEVAGSPATVRAWAVSQNIKVPSRGRIPNDVYVKFQAATGEGQKAK